MGAEIHELGSPQVTLAVEPHAAIGKRGSLLGMRHHQQGCAMGAHLFIEQSQRLRGGLRVKVAGGFVGQNQLRPMDQGACEGHPLLLTPGELMREGVLPVGKPHLGEHVAGQCSGLS